MLIVYGEWTDVIGITMIGRKEIEKQHAYPFTTVLGDATLDAKSFRSKWLDENNKIVSIDINGNQVAIEHLMANQYLVLDIFYLILLA